MALLLDSSKFALQSMCLSVPIEAIDTMITDEKAPRDIVEQVVDLGKELVNAETATGRSIKHHNWKKEKEGQL